MTDTDLAIRSADGAAGMTRPSARAIDPSGVVGWGVDADPANDPTYPIRDRSNDDHSGEWARPAQQQAEVEILQSVEHKRLPAVFGTASPPRWLSGAIRRLAFRWSESNWTHWLLLMGADRVNMVEGLVEDVAHAKIPNIPREVGLPAEWKHNKTGLAKKVAVAATVGVILFALTRSTRRDDDGDEESGPERFKRLGR